MKYLIILLSIVTFNTVFGQIDQYKTCSPIIIGYESDTIFKADCKKAIIIWNTSNDELSIEIFKESIHDNHPRVNKIFQEMEGDISLSSKLDASVFEISNNSPSDHPITGFAYLTMNGVSKEVKIEYQVHGIIDAVNRKNGSLFTQSKLILNLFFNPKDFAFQASDNLSNPMEIEIVEGIINEKD
jgi:hypothetical protein